MTVRVKICCIETQEAAHTAIAAGAHALGLVSSMPSGPGVIAEDAIRRIAQGVPPGVATFLLTSLTDPDAIVAQVVEAGTGVVQLVDQVAVDAYGALRAGLPGRKLIQVIHVQDAGSIEEAMHVAPVVDALLLDSGRPDLPLRELGGTGRVHDWELSRRIVETAGVPVFLAGGITPDNAAQAVAEVRPFAIDVCSGVRTDGRLDPAKVAALMAAVRG